MESPLQTWVFGYGSLIWNPGFSYRRAVRASLKDWQLRFWQASTDHRGTPEFPGRVVTLVPQPGGRVWGRAYALEGDREEILAYLDHREKGGYQRVFFEVEAETGERLRALTYLGPQDNPSFVGPECETLTADVIRRAVGPSGANIDYLRLLDRSLSELDVVEPHVRNLLRLVQHTHPQAL